MVFFNHATRQMTAKIVYYGPGLCGKTTNLNTIYGKTSQKARGEMVSLNTETDRTLFFDLLPLDVGTIGGFKTKLQLYTVPGQVFYNSTRKLVLKGVDGIVFVADSQTPMLDANRESLQNLGDNLRELGLDLQEIPIVFQWNKRDLRQILPVEQMEAELNPRQAPSYLAVASESSGVFETLRGITKLALAHIKLRHLADVNEGKGSPERVEAHPPLPLPTPATPVNGEHKEWVPSTMPRMPVPSSAGASPQALTALKPAFVPKPMGVTLPVLPRAVAPVARTQARMPNLLPMLPAAGSNLRIQLPVELEDSDLEIRVQVLQKGRVVGEASLLKPAPAKGGSGRLALEWKRG